MLDNPVTTAALFAIITAALLSRLIQCVHDAIDSLSRPRSHLISHEQVERELDAALGGIPDHKPAPIKSDRLYGDTPSLRDVLDWLLSLLHLRIIITRKKPKRKRKNDELRFHLGEDGELVEDDEIPAPNINASHSTITS